MVLYNVLYGVYVPPLYRTQCLFLVPLRTSIKSDPEITTGFVEMGIWGIYYQAKKRQTNPGRMSDLPNPNESAKD